MNILITGGAGFIGSNFSRYMVTKYPQHKFVVFDKLTYAGNLENLKEIEDRDNYEFIRGDVCDLNFLNHILKKIDVVFHFAAESHVSNSIGDSLQFTMSNTYGSHVLMEAARLNKIKRFVHVSTDEVYGEIEHGAFTEKDKLAPNNPYAASKAAADMIVRAYYKTYKLPIIITRGNNVYGPYQYPEKIIPRFICKLILDQKMPLHGKGDNQRTYIHVDDVSTAMDAIFQKGQIGEIYNIGTDNEIANIDLAKLLLEKFNKPLTYIEHVEDRPFNDQRYGLDVSKLKGLGWLAKIDFETGLDNTIEWYKNNKQWWSKLITSKW